MTMTYITEPEKQIPVVRQVDVLVAGGGSAGVAAAIAAARRGMKTLIVEQYGSLGGTGTNALVTPLMGIGVPGPYEASGIGSEIYNMASEMGVGNGLYEPENIKLVFQRLALNAGVEVMYHTLICDVLKDRSTVTGVIIENKDGRSAILAKRVIDCTGNGDVCFRAGVPYESGNPENGKNQAISLRYMVAGADEQRISDFFESLDPHFPNLATDGRLHTAFMWVNEHRWAIAPVIRKAYEAGDLEYTDGIYWQVTSIPGFPGCLAFNNPGIYEHNNGACAGDLTRAQLLGRETIHRQMKFYRKYIPGFEKAYLVQVAPMVGVRESRRIRGRYYLTLEDVFHYRKFPDSLVKNNYPVDVHSATNEEEFVHYSDVSIPEEEKYYEIPYGCIVPEKVDNLLMAGRCVSCDFFAQSSMRIIPICHALGEAAGIAAALSIQADCTPAQLDGILVHDEMEKSRVK